MKNTAVLCFVEVSQMCLLAKLRTKYGGTTRLVIACDFIRWIY